MKNDNHEQQAEETVETIDCEEWSTPVVTETSACAEICAYVFTA